MNKVMTLTTKAADALDGIVTALQAAIRQALAQRDTRLAALEARLADLEARLASAKELRGITYRGVFKLGEVYCRNDCSTFSGSLWMALRDDVREVPGSGSDSGWQLCVKSGESRGR